MEVAGKTNVESRVELRLKAAGMPHRCCSNEERALVESVDEEQPPEGYAVEVGRARREIKTVRRGVVGSDLAHVAAVKVRSALRHHQRVGIDAQRACESGVVLESRIARTGARQCLSGGEACGELP